MRRPTADGMREVLSGFDASTGFVNTLAPSGSQAAATSAGGSADAAASSADVSSPGPSRKLKRKATDS